MANPLYDQLFAAHEGSEAPFLHLADGKMISYAGRQAGGTG
jgi:hypothetical protein